MRFLYSPRFLFLLSVAWWAWFSVGCAPVDRWELFVDSLPSQHNSDVSTPTIVPVEFQTSGPEPHVLHFSAEEPIKLSVEQAIMLALHNNRDLEVRQFSPVITGTFEQIERGMFDPEFFVESEYFRG